MAVTETTTKNVVRMMLNNGTDAQGNTKTVGVSIGTLGVASTWDATKVMTVASAIEDCLTKTIINVVRTQTSTLES